MRRLKQALSMTSHLSSVRTFLFVGLAAVWFSEGVLTGVQPLAEILENVSPGQPHTCGGPLHHPRL